MLFQLQQLRTQLNLSHRRGIYARFLLPGHSHFLFPLLLHRSWLQCLLLQLQTRLTPIVLRERADSVRLQVKAAPPLPEWAAYRTTADHCLQLAVSSKTDKDANACKFSDSVRDMQVFDSAFLSSVHDLQHATMRLDPRDTFLRINR